MRGREIEREREGERERRNTSPGTKPRILGFTSTAGIQSRKAEEGTNSVLVEPRGDQVPERERERETGPKNTIG